MNVVWFKRDLRLVDHLALQQALSQDAPVLCLHIIEPNLWQEPDMSGRQYAFYCEALMDLLAICKRENVPFCVRVGDVLDVFQGLCDSQMIGSIFSHQETGNDWTYKRDLRMKKWCNQMGIRWQECQQFAVFRPLKNRDGWSRRWAQLMNQALVSPALNHAFVALPSDDIPKPISMGLGEDACSLRLRGGREQGLNLLHTFFENRGCFYTTAMSSPNTAPTACSRLSPYITFGCLSMKEVHHYARRFQAPNSFANRSNRTAWRQSTRSFTGRLRWHCHFIQKLEDQPSIETQNVHSAYDDLTYHAPEERDAFRRWQDGKTGYPFVDACMRALKEWGWLNFRMRAMVMSFASHHLWLHWREPALYLARQFVDYEPGIHYSQCQMQAGTTGINAVRIYNPIKQGLDHDPNGDFIRKWVPELRHCAVDYIHQPWLLGSGNPDYFSPIVDEKSARKAAAQQLYRIRRSTSFKSEAAKIVDKHASRRSPRSRSRRPKASDLNEQLPLLKPSS